MSPDHPAFTGVCALRDGRMPHGEHTFLPMDKVIFGRGSLARLGAEVARLQARRVLVVTGATIARETNLVPRIAATLGPRHVATFDGTRQHVPRHTVIAAAQTARDARADLVVALGGSTPSDTAKLVALCLAADIRRESQLDDYPLGPGGTGARPIPVGLIPTIALPTTLSAGEYTPWAGSSDPQRGVKDAFGAPQMTPKLVILDPELTLATPAWLWLSTGMRAMDHAVETVCSVGHQPFADAVALHAVKLLVQSLRATIEDPSDIDARGLSQLGSWLSVTGLPNVPGGMSHAIGHQLGARCDVPHGICSCIILPEVMDFTAARTVERQELIAQAMDSCGAAAGSGTVAQRLRDLTGNMGIGLRLSDWGVERQDLAMVARDASQDFMASAEPLAAANAGEIEQLLHRVF